jgi:hypothetical protein
MVIEPVVVELVITKDSIDSIEPDLCINALPSYVFIAISPT